MAGIYKRIFPLKKRRKRLRGFRRFLLDHRRRAAVPEALDLAYLLHYQRAYIKLGLAPWAVNEKPPLLIRSLWVSRLLADFWNWHQALAARYPDFYLAVWLYEPEFGRSQLVAGLAEKQDWYQDVWGELIAAALPAEYRAMPGVNALRWIAHAEVTTYWPDEFAELPARQRSRPHYQHTLASGEQVVVVEIGRVWVGQAPPGRR